MTEKIERIFQAAKLLEIAETLPSDRLLPKRKGPRYCLGVPTKRKNSKKFSCAKCKTDVWLTGDTKKFVEQKKGKSICAKCALMVMKKTKKFQCAMFENDKKKTEKMLSKRLDKELDNLVPFEGG